MYEMSSGRVLLTKRMLDTVLNGSLFITGPLELPCAKHQIRLLSGWSRQRYLDLSKSKKRHVVLPRSVKTFYFDKLFPASIHKLKTSHLDLSSIFSPALNDKPPANVREMTDEKLLDFLHSKKHAEHVLFEIELECVNRVNAWSAKQLLQAAAVFYQAGYTAKNYTSNMMTAFKSLSNNLSKQEILQLLFFIIHYGESPEHLMMTIEETLENEELHPHEVSLICMAYFLCNRRLKSQQLLLNISEKLKMDINHFNPNGINNVLKAFRHAGHVSLSLCNLLGNHMVDMNKLCDPNKFFINIMELCRYFSSIRYYHENLLRCIVDRLHNVSKLMSMRSKDYAQLLMYVAQFGGTLDDGGFLKCQDQLSQFLNEGQYDIYPEALVTSLNALSMMKFYPSKLVHFCLSAENIRKLRGLPHIEKNQQLLIIHISAMIECPHYDVQPPQWFIKTFPEPILGITRHERNTRIGLDRLVNVLRSTYGHDAVACHCILPCFQTASIELHFDENQQPVQQIYSPDLHPLPERISHLRQFIRGQTSGQSESVTGQIAGQSISGQTEDAGAKVASSEVYDALIAGKPLEPSARVKPDHSKLRKISIELLGYHQCTVNTVESQGLARLKHRLLTRLGYDVILIRPEEGKRFLEMFDDDVLHLIQHRINNSNNDQRREGAR